MSTSSLPRVADEFRGDDRPDPSGDVQQPCPSCQSRSCKSRDPRRQPCPRTDDDRVARTAAPKGHVSGAFGRMRTVLATGLLVGSVLTVGTVATPTVRAAQDDQQVQPGDRFGNNYCTVGPSYAEYVFTPKHCGWLGGLGDTATTNGDEAPGSGEAAGTDWRFSIAPTAPDAISTWADCPSIRTSDEDPITVSSCQRVDADLSFVGIVQPWRGLSVSKSGATTGTTTGVAMNSPATEGPNADGTLFVQDLYLCKGDSGSVAFADIDGARYLVGMVTGGTGSLAVDQPLATYADNDKACYRTVDDDNYGEIISIAHLCRQLPALPRNDCLIEAGTPHAKLDIDSDGGDGVTVSAIGFDPDTAGQQPVQRVDITVDGQPILYYRTTRADAARFGLSGDGKWGVVASTTGLVDGVHEICAIFHNEKGTTGIDTRQCSSLAICNAAPADHTVIGTPDADQFVATTGRDLLIGGGGQDTVAGLAANDCFFDGTPQEVLAVNAPNGSGNAINPADRCPPTDEFEPLRRSSTLGEALDQIVSDLTEFGIRRGRSCQ